MGVLIAAAVVSGHVDGPLEKLQQHNKVLFEDNGTAANPDKARPSKPIPVQGARSLDVLDIPKLPSKNGPLVKQMKSGQPAGGNGMVGNGVIGRAFVGQDGFKILTNGKTADNRAPDCEHSRPPKPNPEQGSGGSVPVGAIPNIIAMTRPLDEQLKSIQLAGGHDKFKLITNGETPHKRTPEGCTCEQTQTPKPTTPEQGGGSLEEGVHPGVGTIPDVGSTLNNGGTVEQTENRPPLPPMDPIEFVNLQKPKYNIFQCNQCQNDLRELLEKTHN